MDFSCLVLFVVDVSHFDFEILTSVTHRFASKTRLFISIFMSLALYPSNAFTVSMSKEFCSSQAQTKGLLYQHYARRIEVLEPILMEKSRPSMYYHVVGAEMIIGVKEMVRQYRCRFEKQNLHYTVKLQQNLANLFYDIAKSDLRNCRQMTNNSNSKNDSKMY